MSTSQVLNKSTAYRASAQTRPFFLPPHSPLHLLSPAPKDSMQPASQPSWAALPTASSSQTPQASPSSSSARQQPAPSATPGPTLTANGKRRGTRMPQSAYDTLIGTSSQFFVLDPSDVVIDEGLECCTMNAHIMRVPLCCRVFREY